MYILDELIHVYGNAWTSTLENILNKNVFLHRATEIKKVYHHDLVYDVFDLSYRQEAYCHVLIEVPNKTSGVRHYVMAAIDTEIGRWGNFKTRIVFKRYYPDGNIPTRKRSIRKGKFVMADACSARNSCQITTLAKVMNLEPETVLTEMKLRGWSESNPGNFLVSKGLTKNRFEEMLELAGLQANVVWLNHKIKEIKGVNKVNETFTELDDFEGCTVKTAAKHLKKGIYVVSVRGHVLSIVDGTIFDTWNSSTKRVIRIYKIEKI